MRLSQNAQQVLDEQYSYTKYDQQGRTTEVGELSTTEAIASLKGKLNEARFPASSTYALSDITRTYYDSVDSRVQEDFVQTNVRNRVAWTEVLDQGDDTLTTHYAYDAHGNVKSLLQRVPGLSSKRTDYVYDLVSGNVRFVFYQFDSADQFCQEYRYDADNRLTEVHTSTDRHFWNKEAHYRYYPHGPLARIELGEYRVQGLDYYYTLQGWLKGVNGTNDSNDPGGDGLAGQLNNRVGKDAFAFALGYHEGDYQGIGATPTNNGLWDRLDEQHPGEPGQAAYRGPSRPGLYNGNIAWMQTNLPGLKQQGIDPQQAMLYQYDQLNRLVQAQSLRNFSEISGFASRTATPEGFDASYEYNANGNLLTLQRHNAQAALQDDFTYQYEAGKNRLLSVDDAIQGDTIFYDNTTYNTSPLNSDGKVYRTITVEDNVTVTAGQSPSLRANESITLKQNFHAQAGSGFHAKWTDEANYEVNNDDSQFTYDAIGNLIADDGEGTSIDWTPYGKPRTVTKDDGTVVNYRYDAAGNRVEKQVVTSDSTYSTRYIRDASGNVLAIYENDSLLEQPIYGSSRLGMYSGETAPGQQQLGHRRYELSSHLGNVLSVITDNVNMDSDSAWATVVSTQDYFSFGLEQKGRSFNTTAYRHDFNGKETDTETGWQDYGMRVYLKKYNRFASVDPLTRSYPTLTPYQFASNTPIQAIDLDGEEAKITINSQYNAKRTAMLFNGGKTNVERNLNRQKALVIGWYSVDKGYENDAHTRMYPDVDFPTHGKAATLERDNSFEGVQIWGTSESGEEYYIGSIDQQNGQGWFSSALDGLRDMSSGKERGATELEKIIYKNVDQSQLEELYESFGGELHKINFLKEKGLLPEKVNTLTGLPRYQGPYQEFKEVPGDSGVYRGFDREGNYGPRIGPRLSPGGGISERGSRSVRDKKDSTKYNIK